MGKGRERQIILKTDQRTVRLRGEHGGRKPFVRPERRKGVPRTGIGGTCGSSGSAYSCGGPFGSVSLGPTYRLNYPSGGSRSPKVSRARGDAEIAHWLEKLGLGQYAQRFSENDIGFALLPDLTDQQRDRGVARWRSGPEPGQRARTADHPQDGPAHRPPPWRAWWTKTVCKT